MQTPIQTQRPNSLTQKDKAEILNQVKKLIPTRHINVKQPNQDYGKWVARVEERTPELVAAEDPAVFERGIRELLEALETSHTAFFQKDGGKVPAPFSINASLRAVETAQGKRWMFEDVVEDGPAALAGIQPGQFLLSIDSKPLTPQMIPTFSLGGSHSVEIGSLSGDIHQVTLQIPDKKAKDRPPMVEPKSLSYSFLPPDIGFLKVSYFPGTIGQAYARNLDHAIEELKTRGTNRLVIDLRGNIGGALGSLRLMSYLCPGKVEIGHSLTRRRLLKGYDREKLTRIGKIPSGKMDLLLMFFRFKFIQRDRSMILVTEGLGPQPFHGRIVILVNHHCRSAAEMVAGFAKDNQLAKLVGTTTGGEVLGGANFGLPKGYCLRIPVAAWYTWKGNCIEGAGVEPAVLVENTPEALAAGTDTQLQKALELIRQL